MEDISFSIGNHKFNYRVAAVIEYKQQYLLTTTSEIDFWFLPGGRVQAGETSLEAIERELQEELDLEDQAVQLLWTVENFYRLNGENFHEISFYYAVSLSENTRFINEDRFWRNPDLGFGWFELEAIKRLDLRPHFLKAKLTSVNQGFKHIIFREEEQLYVEV